MVGASIGASPGPGESLTHSQSLLSLSNDISPVEVARHRDESYKADNSLRLQPQPLPRSATAAGAKRGGTDAAPAALQPAGQLPPLRTSESAAALLQHEVPLLPMQQLQRASTVHGIRLARLPTPKGTVPTRLDFQLPAPQSTSSLSGLVGAYNLFGAECQKYLNLSEKSSMLDSMGSMGKKDVEVVDYFSFEFERQRKARANACDAAVLDIARLNNERRAMLESTNKHASVGGEKKKEAEEEARRQEEARREADKAIVEQQKKLRQSRSISGRVEARLLELRSDDAARLELESRVMTYKQQRADGHGQVVSGLCARLPLDWH